MRLEQLRQQLSRQQARERRLAAEQRATAARGEERHQALDAEVEEMKEVRAELVAGFNNRISQIEANTETIGTNVARIAELERRIADLAARVDAHRAEPAGKAHK